MDTDTSKEAGSERRRSLKAAGVLLGSFAIHLLLIPTRGWEQDLHWFLVWTRAAVEHGVAHVAEHVWCDYPPLYLYLLKVVGGVWMVVSGGDLPADGTLAARFIVKLLPSLCDVATAWVLYRIALSQRAYAVALAVLGAFAFNPAIVFNSAVWGQADSVFTLPLILCLWLTASGRIATASGFLVAALFLKLQAIVVVPLFLVAVLRLHGAQGVLAAIRGGALVAVVLLLPFYVAGTTGKLISTMITVTQRYPYISMNAHNLWWLIGGEQSPRISDLMRVGSGLLTYRAIGAVMLASATGIILWRLLRNLKYGREGVLFYLLEACALQVIAFYLFPTQMHERYVLPAIAPLAALCIWQPRLWRIYFLLSIAMLITLASTLYLSFPQPLGGLELLFLPRRWETVIVSIAIIAIFAILLLREPDRRFRILAPVAVTIVALLLAVIARLPLPARVRLSDWEPISSTQQWGSLRFNRTVEGRRLSVAGFIFRHGIGTHALSKLKYHLNGGFSSFDTAFALDDEARHGQSARFRIMVDERIAYDSGDIKPGGFPYHANVSVAGAEYLVLEVYDGDDGIDADHADWLEPTLVR